MANDIASFSVSLYEPTSIVVIIENDTSKMLNFLIYPGRLELTIDAANPRQSKFFNSSLNEDATNFNRMRDSISNIVYTSKVMASFKNLTDNSKDSIRELYDKYMIILDKKIYKEGFKNTSSFLTLQHIEFWLQEIRVNEKKGQFTKRQLKRLFNKLDKNMCAYPTYQRRKELFKLKEQTLPKINKPIV